MKKFFDFIREQGIVGLAVGFILGGSVSKVVDSLVQDIINPLLGVLLGLVGGLAEASFFVFGAEVLWGHFLSVLIDFIIIAMVVFLLVKILHLDKLDKNKS